MKKNLVQKFREFYFALPKEEQTALFEVITALRGEDGGDWILKNFTTARIRGALFGKSQVGFAERAICFASLKKAEAYNRKTWIGDKGDLMTLWMKSDSHFRAHIERAIRALIKFGSKRAISDLMKFI